MSSILSNKKFWGGIGLVALVIYLIVLYIYDPSDTLWIPKCWFKLITNLDCPSCGAQRAIYELLHGNIREAFTCNPYMFCISPYVILILITFVIPENRATKLRNFCYHWITIATFVLSVLVWWVLRNILGI